MFKLRQATPVKGDKLEVMMVIGKIMSGFGSPIPFGYKNKPSILLIYCSYFFDRLESAATQN